MQHEDTEKRPDGWGGTGPSGDGGANRRVLTRFGLTAALTVFLASTMPQPLIAASLSSLSLLAGLVLAGLAALLRERPNGPVLNRWDESAALLALSLLAGFFVDPAAVTEALQAQ